MQVVGDTMGLDKSTVSRVISDVTEQLVSKRGMFINWPRPEDRTRICEGFFRLGGFSNVVGYIDGTHIKLQGPRADEPAFVNRKGYHSLNMQAVCDHEGKHTDIQIL